MQRQAQMRDSSGPIYETYVLVRYDGKCSGGSEWPSWRPLTLEKLGAPARVAGRGSSQHSPGVRWHPSPPGGGVPWGHPWCAVGARTASAPHCAARRWKCKAPAKGHKDVFPIRNDAPSAFRCHRCFSATATADPPANTKSHCQIINL